jgi:hypothetical protein
MGRGEAQNTPANLPAEVTGGYLAPMSNSRCLKESPGGLRAGLRFGERGTHTSRTMMLVELRDLLGVLPAGTDREGYWEAIVGENVLRKATQATREQTAQRLGELYGLDPLLALFRVLRRVWTADEAGRPVAALLCALARDPLLRSTARPVLGLAEGAELIRGSFLETIRAAVGDRLNAAVLDKVARNAASTWSQSGHLAGRMRKLRRRIMPTAGPLALALWLGSLEGLDGQQLLASRWTAVLDRSPKELESLVLRAKQIGLIQASIGGGAMCIEFQGLDAALSTV